MRPTWPRSTRQTKDTDARTPAPYGVPRDGGARRLDRALAAWRRTAQHRPAEQPAPAPAPETGAPETERAEPLPAPTISIRGAVPHRARESLTRVLADAASNAPREVTGIRASLTRHADPAATAAVEARATITLSGRDVHAHAAAATEREAIHALETRLRRILEDIGGRDLTARR